MLATVKNKNNKKKQQDENDVTTINSDVTIVVFKGPSISIRLFANNSISISTFILFLFILQQTVKCWWLMSKV